MTTFALLLACKWVMRTLARLGPVELTAWRREMFAREDSNRD